MSLLPTDEGKLEYYKQQCLAKDIWIEEQRKEIDRLKSFYDYFAELYGKGLEVANWHYNDELEPYDNFFDSAEEDMNK